VSKIGGRVIRWWRSTALMHRRGTLDVCWHLRQTPKLPSAFQLQLKDAHLPSLVTPLLILLLRLLVPPASVKANMLETSPERSRRLEAGLRRAEVGALVRLQEEGGFSACHQAGWVCYSAARQSWRKDMWTYRHDSWDLNVRKVHIQCGGGGG